MASYNFVNIGSGDGLLPHGTKPLPESILSDHQIVCQQQQYSENPLVRWKSE